MRIGLPSSAGLMAAANLGLVMRSLFGLGTPQGWAERLQALLAGIWGRFSRSPASSGYGVAFYTHWESLIAEPIRCSHFDPSLPLANSPLAETT